MVVPPATTSPSKRLIVAKRRFQTRRRHEPVHAHDEHVLVVRPVEDADLTGTGQCPPDAPEEGVGQLLGRRLLERREVDSLRVDCTDDVPHDAALARRVEALDDEQQGAPAAAARLGVEPLLQPGEPLGAVYQLLRGRCLAALAAGGRIRVESGQVEPVADTEQLAQLVFPGHLAVDPKRLVLERDSVSSPRRMKTAGRSAVR